MGACGSFGQTEELAPYGWTAGAAKVPTWGQGTGPAPPPGGPSLCSQVTQQQSSDRCFRIPPNPVVARMGCQCPGRARPLTESPPLRAKPLELPIGCSFQSHLRAGLPVLNGVRPLSGPPAPKGAERPALQADGQGREAARRGCRFWAAGEGAEPSPALLPRIDPGPPSRLPGFPGGRGGSAVGDVWGAPNSKAHELGSPGSGAVDPVQTPALHLLSERPSDSA